MEILRTSYSAKTVEKSKNKLRKAVTKATISAVETPGSVVDVQPVLEFETTEIETVEMEALSDGEDEEMTEPGPSTRALKESEANRDRLAEERREQHEMMQQKPPRKRARSD
jgi:hypothetical protein